MPDKTSLLQINDWRKCFENAATRSSAKQFYALMPIKQSGVGYTYLLEKPNGEAMYGAFVALILRLFHQPTDVRDGWLTDDGTETGNRYTPKTLAPLLQFSEKTIMAMLKVVTKEIGWIVNHSNPAKHAEGYPGKIVSDELLALSKKFHDAQKANHPYELAYREISRDKTDYEGAKKLDALITKYKVPLETVKALLDWIPTSTFWGRNMHSLATALDVKNNGSLKILNAKKQMDVEQDRNLLTSEQMLKAVDSRGLSTSDFVAVDVDGQKRWKQK